ncbi:MAG: acyl-CoA dehydrogenase family protein [Pseudomonadales bacterium]|jgi:hypothetical protein|nr:acyl-CoA dehydrogenase family protein [Pseudomonadales bacterium]MDP6469720.1 acyl-CoA dehydrogenase family protein [Pseudomonadales bacterium]MDP6827679.1 acyl-CoA dehydrogenase family protein [Pseudomonadales bacterium]MDP6971881.1 acyl-CoA dehydrogenase family protein [Pseudomonadales bacterium]|tara:strand:+ start:648 stop:968 length:321 start_codon:yes stop_codon:yes gene_type:complete
MESEFNEDQRLVRDSIRRFLDTEIQPYDDEYGDQEMTPALAKELIGCVAISEPNVGSDPTSIECRAELKEDRWVINGTKPWISNGRIVADHWNIPAVAQVLRRWLP